jgi:hypothetical protein
MKSIFVVDNYTIQKGDRIKGNISLASGLVDEIIFVNFTAAFTPIVYLSNIAGKFLADDGLFVTRSGVTTYVGKLIAGSITAATVEEANRVPGQSVGDRVRLVSRNFGVDAIATVLDVSDTSTGQINFAVQDGGFGYVGGSSTTARNKVGISNQVLIVTQRLSPTIKPGDIITCEGAVVTAPVKTFLATPIPINGSAIVISYRHPLLYIKTLDNASRTAALNKTVEDGPHACIKLIPIEMLRTVVGQSTENDDWDNIFQAFSPNGYAYGDINHSRTLNSADASAMLNYQVIRDMEATFKINNNTAGTLSSVGKYNASASYEVSNITNNEFVTLITDQIGDFDTVRLDSSDYGMIPFGAETINTKLKDSFTSITEELGTISNIKVLSSGASYENDVYSKVEYSPISRFDKKDIIINFSNTNFLLSVGDIITQARQIEDPVG